VVAIKMVPLISHGVLYDTSLALSDVLELQVSAKTLNDMKVKKVKVIIFIIIFSDIKCYWINLKK